MESDIRPDIHEGTRTGWGRGLQIRKGNCLIVPGPISFQKKHPPRGWVPECYDEAGRDGSRKSLSKRVWFLVSPEQKQVLRARGLVLLDSNPPRLRKLAADRGTSTRRSLKPFRKGSRPLPIPVCASVFYVTTGDRTATSGIPGHGALELRLGPTASLGRTPPRVNRP